MAKHFVAVIYVIATASVINFYFPFRYSLTNDQHSSAWEHIDIYESDYENQCLRLIRQFQLSVGTTNSYYDVW